VQEEFNTRITAAMSTQRTARYEQIDATVSTPPVLRDDEMLIAPAGVSRNLSAPSGAMD